MDNQKVIGLLSIVCVVSVFVGVFIGILSEAVEIDELNYLLEHSEGQLSLSQREVKRLVNALADEKLEKNMTFTHITIKGENVENGTEYRVTMKIDMTFNESRDAMETSITYVKNGGTITIWDKAVILHEDMMPEDKWFRIKPRESYSTLRFYSYP